MNETRDMPQQLAALLAWYREMGVSAALDEAPIDWRARGDLAPGAAFVMPAPARTEPLAQSAAQSVPVALEPFRRVPATPPAAITPKPPPSITPAPTVRSFAGSASPAAYSAAKVSAATLAELGAALTAFEGCALKATAKNLCLYRGAEKARVMIIGEAPGREEDLAGKPLVGPSGTLLDLMLAAISLTPAEVHITNFVYWRPPGNRLPTQQEAQACAPFLARQIELVAPDVILLLGGASAKQLLSTDDGIMKVRGKWREIANGGRTIKAIATLHPQYVLKTPASKRQVWSDLLALKSNL